MNRADKRRGIAAAFISFLILFVACGPSDEELRIIRDVLDPESLSAREVA